MKHLIYNLSPHGSTLNQTLYAESLKSTETKIIQ